MVNKIKGKIKHFVDIRLKNLKEHQSLLEQTNFNYNQLNNLFKESHFIPFSAWAISPSTILHVLNDITINKRNSIIEFGAGASTFYIAKLIKTLDLNTVFYSVESDKDWLEELNRQLKLLNLEEYVKIIYAPLKNAPLDIVYKKQITWYDTDILEEYFEESLKFDVVLVDGPFGGSTPYARYTAIPFLKSRLAADFSVYLDDINRAQENEIALQWKEKLDCTVVFRERYAVLTNTSKFEVSPFQIG